MDSVFVLNCIILCWTRQMTLKKDTIKIGCFCLFSLKKGQNISQRQICENFSLQKF